MSMSLQQQKGTEKLETGEGCDNIHIFPPEIYRKD